MSAISLAEKELLTYQDIVESFFDKHYPQVEKEKFWNWFILNMIGTNKSIADLNEAEVVLLLAKLREVGDELYNLSFIRMSQF